MMHCPVAVGLAIFLGVYVAFLLICRSSAETSTSATPSPTFTPDSNLYATILGLRNLELSTHWTRFNINLLLNGGLLLAAVSAQRQGTTLANLGTKPYFFGLALAVLWLCSELAGRNSLHRFDAKVQEFETSYWPESFRLLEALGAPRGTHTLNPFSGGTLRIHMVVSLLVILLFNVGWCIVIALGS